jgi:DNA-binding NarL/FixJ family response regulator
VLLGGAPRPSAGLGLDPGLASLKTRPLEIALCFLAGDTDQEIASSLHISCSTVRRNLRSTMRALGLADRAALRRAFARADGWNQAPMLS